MEHKELRDIIAIGLRRLTIISKVNVDEELDNDEDSRIIVVHNNKTLEVIVLDV